MVIASSFTTHQKQEQMIIPLLDHCELRTSFSITATGREVGGRWSVGEKGEIAPHKQNGCVKCPIFSVVRFPSGELPSKQTNAVPIATFRRCTVYRPDHFALLASHPKSSRILRLPSWITAATADNRGNTTRFTNHRSSPEQKKRAVEDVLREGTGSIRPFPRTVA